MRIKSELIKGAAYAGLILGGAAVGVAKVHAATFTWHMVGGINSTPKEYIATTDFCDVRAVYHFTDDQEWQVWFNAGAELEFLNDQFVMESSRGYWVVCR